MPTLRRTRFVCISDTHNCRVSLPKGDVLIHAGDLTNQGTHSELSKAVQWLEEADFEAKIVVAGNHDITLDQDFYSRHGLRHHNQCPQSAADCLALLAGSTTITYLCHSSATVRLSSPDGPRTSFAVFGSPFSPARAGPRPWAFGYETPHPHLAGPAADLPALWDAVPLAADVVVTHTPARGHRDETGERRPAGCEALRRALWRVRPLLAVCGHVHEGRGAERVRWRLDQANVAHEEEGVEEWVDPAGGRGRRRQISLVDLTGRTGLALDNDGGHPPAGGVADAGPATAAVTAVTAATAAGDDAAVPGSGTQGLGENPDSVRSDQEALRGRMGRRETCVVNCSIVATRYPHAGGKKFNKPVVVDLLLPVWDEQ